MSKLLLVALVGVALWLYLRRSAPKPVSSEREALEILGLGPDADAAAVRDAHRRLIAAIHPDRGGSAELARRVNAARDVLLARLRH